MVTDRKGYRGTWRRMIFYHLDKHISLPFSIPAM
jgi:hypothetical protein